MKKILAVFGTRPEAIKFAPLIRELQKHPHAIELKVCVTGQHRSMLQQVLDFFEIIPDYDLGLMRAGQTLHDITADVLHSLKQIFNDEYQPDYVIVQGDTTSALAGAMAAFYHKIPVIHLEAGLRSHNRYSPFPEEMNRVMIGRLADYHLAPTQLSKQNLLNEKISRDNILMCGNTVIDSLLLGLQIIKESDQDMYFQKFDFLDFNKKIILITGHRRENFGEPFQQMCDAITEIADRYPDVQMLYPVHLNPNVQQPVRRLLSAHKNIFLIDPLEYNYLIWLMEKSYFILTDSGGIQEEAPALGKPVLVMRDVTERTEGIDAGTAKLVGTTRQAIVDASVELLESDEIYGRMANAVNPYGDGTASKQIAEFMIADFVKYHKNTQISHA